MIYNDLSQTQQGLDSSKTDSPKWVRLQHDRTLLLYDTPSSNTLIDEVKLGEAVRIAPGGTLFYVQTIAGVRVELKHNDATEVQKWVRALSQCKNHAADRTQVLKRKHNMLGGQTAESNNKSLCSGINDPSSTAGSQLLETSLSCLKQESKSKSSHPATNDLSESAASQLLETSVSSPTVRDAIDSNGECNVLQEIAGSNLSEDEYDPEEDTVPAEIARSRADGVEPTFYEQRNIMNPPPHCDEVLDSHRQQALNAVRAPLPTSTPDAVRAPLPTSTPSAPRHRAFLNFDEGAFLLHDRPRLKLFFERYGEVVDVYLPSYNRKVDIEPVLPFARTPYNIFLQDFAHMLTMAVRSAS